MKKLLIILLSVLTLCTAAFTGCTGADRNTTSAQTAAETAVDDGVNQPPEEAEPAPEPVPLPEPAPGDKDCRRCRRRRGHNSLEIIINFPKLHVYDLIKDENGISFKPFPKPEEPEQPDCDGN